MVSSSSSSSWACRRRPVRWQRQAATTYTARILLVLVWLVLAILEFSRKYGHGGAEAFGPQRYPICNPFRQSPWDLDRRHYKCHHQQHRLTKGNERSSVSTTTTCVRMFPSLPSSYEYDDQVVFTQRATNTKIVGKDQLEQSLQQWDQDFRQEVDGNQDGDSQNHPRVQTVVATTVSPTTLLLRWNLTYVDPSVTWLVSLAETVPGWEPDFRSYTDQASQIRTFSYSAVARLFGDAVRTGKLRVPMACIEGTTTCEFVESDTHTNTNTIVSVAEDLAYAQDLQRNRLSNRICARDLQFFLEVARKPLEYSNATSETKDEYWEDVVADRLPWRSVPGMMDPLYIENQSEEDLQARVPLVFGTLSVILVLVFASWVAPNLIGQSLLGPPSYIVPPSELNDIIGY